MKNKSMNTDLEPLHILTPSFVQSHRPQTLKITYIPEQKAFHIFNQRLNVSSTFVADERQPMRVFMNILELLMQEEDC